MMDKFEHVDVIASLEAIMRRNTAYYQSDFEIDKEIIRRAAASAEPQDKNLLWMSRPSGTFCLRERDVFLRDTYANNTWRFYGEQTRDKILAYAVELAGMESGKVVGTLYGQDYRQHFTHVQKEALPIARAFLTFADGKSRDFPYSDYEANRGRIEYEYGIIKSAAFSPRSETELQGVLEREHLNRQDFRSTNFKEHISALTDTLITDEARHIQAELQAQKEPNSPNKTHFMAQMSPEFMLLTDTREQDRLFNMLPYKSLSVSGLKDRKGLFVMVGRDESRDLPLRQPRASVKKQLQAEHPVAKPSKKPEMER
jgi:hypothetical protein